MEGIVMIIVAIAAVVILAIAKQRRSAGKPTPVLDAVEAVIDDGDVRELAKELDASKLPGVADVILGLLTRDYLRAAKAARKLLADIRARQLTIKVDE